MAENEGLLLSRARGLEEQVFGLIEAVYEPGLFPGEWEKGEVGVKVRQAFTEIYAAIVRNEKIETTKD